MIHKKSGRIRTYGRPAPDLLGWVAGLAPLIAFVPETDALCYPACNPRVGAPTIPPDEAVTNSRPKGFDY
ncbi:hypothetical protein ACS0TY_021114 [Phlomoides rotata]